MVSILAKAVTQLQQDYNAVAGSSVSNTGADWQQALNNPHDPVSVKSLVAVAEACAVFADHRTGCNCRPTNARLAAMTGLSVRTVQRASTALRLLGVATEVMRGRQRTLAERFASWRVGDTGRGRASVWALHDCRIQSLSPHPGGLRVISHTGSFPRRCA